MRIALAQLNATVGDLQGNQRKILSALKDAQQQGADIIVFPELVVCGYPPEDLLHKKYFIQHNLQSIKEIARAVKDIVAIIGFVDSDRRKHLYNAAALIHDGQIKSVYHKHELPNYGVFDEKRYFKSGTQLQIFMVGGYRLGVNICEDIWVNQSVYDQQVKVGIDLLINLSSSPYNIGKPAARQKILKERAQKGSCFLACCNLVGGQDELVFDGCSLILSPQGKKIGQGRFCQEDMIVLDLDLSQKKKKYSRLSQSQRQLICSEFSQQSKPALSQTKRESMTAIERMYYAIVLGTRDYIHKNGFEKVVLGLSGGIDSSLVAAIAVDAIGAENVVGVTMPSCFTSKGTRSDAGVLAGNLNMRLIEIPIEQMRKSYSVALKDEFAGLKEDITEENIQARIRGNILMALSNKFGWLVLTTGNKSETAVGYCTLYGDMSGGFAVIKDLLKTKVYALAHFFNQRHRKAMIPQSIIDRPPTAELRQGQTDQDSLPPYAVLDQILTGYVEQHKSLDQLVRQGLDRNIVRRVIELVDLSEYKRRQAPPGVRITSRAFGKDWRLPITNRYRYKK